METTANNLYLPSYNFGFNSDMEHDSVDMKPNSDPWNKSDLNSNLSDSNDSNINPWRVENMKEFLHYHCPQCEFKSKELIEFYSHAVENHQQARTEFCKDSNVTPDVKDIDVLPEIMDRSQQTNLDLSTVEMKLKEKINIEKLHRGNKEISLTGEKSINMKLKEKRHSCSLCGKSYGSPYILQEHVELVHEKKKNHKCHLCSYVVGRKGDLNRHIAGVHEKKKTHKCSLCDYSALGSQNLKRHIESVHEKIRIPCDYCDATFSRKESLNIHIASVHEGKKPNKCSMCDLQFATKKRLKRHLEQVHEKKDRKICEMCSSTFSHIGNLKAHIASVHEGKKTSKDRD